MRPVIRSALPLVAIAASTATAERVPHADDPAPARTVLGREAVIVPLDTASAAAPRPTIEVTIEGRGPYTLILDTGASITLLQPALAHELDLVPTGTLYVGAELELRTEPDPSIPDQMTVDEVRLDGIEIGSARLEGVPAVVLSPSVRSMPEGISGILGITVFHDCLATIDLPGGELRLSEGHLPPPDGEHVLPFEWDEWLPRITVSIGGEAYAAHVDTGSPGGFTVPGALAETLPLRGSPVVVGRGRTLNATFEIREATLDGDAAIGTHRVASPRLLIQDRLPFVNVGCDVLSGLILTFDQVARRVRVVPVPAAAGGAVRAMASPSSGGPRVQVVSNGPVRLGLMAVPVPGGLEVRETMPGLPAEAAGLRPGDVVREVNGTPVPEYAPGALRDALRSLPLVLVVERDGALREVTVEAP